MRKILRSWIPFLLLGSSWLAGYFLGGCSALPVAQTIDLHWQFVNGPDFSTLACLPEDDVARLREALIRCHNEEDAP